MSSWKRIVLPIPENGVCPDTIHIGKLAWECFERENRPAGFGMFHATEGPGTGKNDKRIIYLSPVAARLCKEIAQEYKLERCAVPACDEPNMAWVFGDPLVKNLLRQTVSSDELVAS